ncbi:VOC family protein [Gordonia sp. (in: high G+C Gram-positive bacteria)]|uniref:VOC family protein n=1 Tax=Gordonia sp. (in: high G+C Gram-positive bacteria) TaxID=84139 RepID=UPI003F956D40
MHVEWLTAYLDFPAAQFGAEVTFWRAISGSTVSPPRGDHKEFATLEPFNGDAHLRVQRVGDDSGGTHLDIHVADPVSASLEAASLGASLIADYGTHRVMSSPGGGVFCLVPHQGESERARPIRWPGGTISIIDQVCFDVPTDLFDAEVAFWEALTGHPTPGRHDPDRVGLTRNPKLALQVLLIRSDVTEPATYLEVAATDIGDEVERHEGWGASVVKQCTGRVMMADPGGRRYFISVRNPRTGS